MFLESAFVLISAAKLRQESCPANFISLQSEGIFPIGEVGKSSQRAIHPRKDVSWSVFKTPARGTLREKNS
jgi:hypothetical protein